MKKYLNRDHLEMKVCLFASPTKNSRILVITGILGGGIQGSLYDTNPNFMHYFEGEIPQNYHTF